MQLLAGRCARRDRGWGQGGRVGTAPGLCSVAAGMNRCKPGDGLSPSAEFNRRWFPESFKTPSLREGFVVFFFFFVSSRGAQFKGSRAEAAQSVAGTQRDDPGAQPGGTPGTSASWPSAWVWWATEPAPRWVTRIPGCARSRPLQLPASDPSSQAGSTAGWERTGTVRK